MKRVCIYHFTDKSEIRPIVCEKQVEILKDFAKQYGTIEKVCVDKSLKDSLQIEKENLFYNPDFDILVTKDFYHINKHTGKCLDVMKNLISKGIRVCSLEDGEFVFVDAPFDKPLRVCLYHSKYHEDTNRTIETQINIFKLFIKSKTNWIITDVFVDEDEKQNDDSQVELMKLIDNNNNYDLIVVKQFSCFHWRTAKFCKRRNQLKLPIYSLKEGYLSYGII